MSRRRRLVLAFGITLAGIVVAVVWWTVAGELTPNRSLSPREQDLEGGDRAEDTELRPRHLSDEPPPRSVPSEKRPRAEPSSPGNRDFIVFVIDADGRPVEGVHVRVAHGGGSAQQWTDATGQVRVVVQGNVEEVYVLQQVSPEQMQYLSPPPRRDLGMATEVRFVLENATLIEGRVLLGDGEPLAWARIDLRSTDHDLRMIMRSDREGKFQARVPVDKTIDLEVTGRWLLRNGKLSSVDDGYEGTAAGIRAGTRDVILRARRSARDQTVLVKTIDPQGAPIAHVKIASPSLRESPTTDESGYVRLDGLPGHRIRLHAVLTTEDTDLIAPESMDVTPHGQEVVFRFVRGVPVAGVVVNPDGSPAAAKILKVRHKTGSATMPTDAAGRFRAYVYPAEDPVQVRVFDDDGKTLLVQVEALPGNNNLRIRLQPGK